jgi:hypothetical protein
LRPATWVGTSGHDLAAEAITETVGVFALGEAEDEHVVVLAPE